MRTGSKKVVVNAWTDEARAASAASRAAAHAKASDHIQDAIDDGKHPDDRNRSSLNKTGEVITKAHPGPSLKKAGWVAGETKDFSSRQHGGGLNQTTYTHKDHPEIEAVHTESGRSKFHKITLFDKS